MEFPVKILTNVKRTHTTAAGELPASTTKGHFTVFALQDILGMVSLVLISTNARLGPITATMKQCVQTRMVPSTATVLMVSMETEHTAKMWMSV